MGPRPACERRMLHESVSMPIVSTLTHRYASPQLRDRFLQSIDSRNWQSSGAIATDLVGCTNPLPGLTCIALELPIGSTYGAAAVRVLQLAATAAVEANSALVLN